MGDGGDGGGAEHLVLRVHRDPEGEDAGAVRAGARGWRIVPEPFDLYSMQQAIEEGFILDVLQNYTPYKVAWKLQHPGCRLRRCTARSTSRRR